MFSSLPYPKWIAGSLAFAVGCLGVSAGLPLATTYAATSAPVFLPLVSAEQPYAPALLFTTTTGDAAAFDSHLFFLGGADHAIQEISTEVGDPIDVAWSPSGERFWYISHNYYPNGTSLSIADRATRTPTVLTTKAAAAAWSPTETMLAYTEHLTDTYPLSVYNLATQQVTQPVPSLASVDAFSWSPDGTKLAVSAGEALYVVGADGSHLQQVASGIVANIAWAPNGASLAFMLRTSPWPLTFSLWAVQPDGSSLHQLASADAGNINFYAWSPDSTKVAYAGADALWLVGAAGTNQQHTSSASVQRIAWSPDSASVAYAAQTGDTTYALRATGADGTNERDLVPAAGSFGALAWQADHQTILYWAGDVLGKVSAQGGAATPIVSGVKGFIGQDTPGDLLFVKQGVQGYGIRSIALDGTGEQLLANVSSPMDHTYLAP